MPLCFTLCHIPQKDLNFYRFRIFLSILFWWGSSVHKVSCWLASWNYRPSLLEIQDPPPNDHIPVLEACLCRIWGVFQGSVKVSSSSNILMCYLSIFSTSLRLQHATRNVHERACIQRKTKTIETFLVLFKNERKTKGKKEIAAGVLWKNDRVL